MTCILIGLPGMLLYGSPSEYAVQYRWGENFVTELMAGSKKRPLLSGYYRLMEIALQLSAQSGLLAADGDFGQVRLESIQRCA